MTEMGYTQHGKLSSFGAEEPMLAAQRRTVERVGDELQKRVTEHTPVAKPPPVDDVREWLAARKRFPGELKRSWKIGTVKIGAGEHVLEVDVYTNDPIAPYVEWPTMPHLIQARPGHTLRFWNEVGKTVFAQLVHHPGTKGSYMMTTAIAEVAAMWRTIGAEEMDRWAREQAAQVAA